MEYFKNICYFSKFIILLVLFFTFLVAFGIPAYRNYNRFKVVIDETTEEPQPLLTPAMTMYSYWCNPFKGFKDGYINPDDWTHFDGDWLKFFTNTCGRINIILHNTTDLHNCFTQISYSQEEMVLSTELFNFPYNIYEQIDIQWGKTYNLGRYPFTCYIHSFEFVIIF